jgi:hypothetical protein
MEILIAGRKARSAQRTWTRCFFIFCTVKERSKNCYENISRFLANLKTKKDESYASSPSHNYRECRLWPWRVFLSVVLLTINIPACPVLFAFQGQPFTGTKSISGSAEACFLLIDSNLLSLQTVSFPTGQFAGTNSVIDPLLLMSFAAVNIPSRLGAGRRCGYQQQQNKKWDRLYNTS